MHNKYIVKKVSKIVHRVFFSYKSLIKTLMDQYNIVNKIVMMKFILNNNL